MNAKQAKERIKIIDLMSSLGHDVVEKQKGGRELRYYSCFRNEKTPSLNVNVDKNIYYDLGESTGGTVIDFAIHFLRSRNKPADLKSALTWLRSMSGQNNPSTLPAVKNSKSFQNQVEPGNDHPKLKFISAKPIERARILSYLHTRGISETTARQYLKEITYLNTEKNKEYYGFGMENLSHKPSNPGYEIRSAGDNPTFKTAFNRDISIIQCRQEGSGTPPTVKVFEGMLDALSLIEMLGQEIKNIHADFLIMHSLSSFKRCVSFIQDQGYTQINLFLDNNPSGRKVSDRFIHGDEDQDKIDAFEGFEDITIIDHACEYDHSDLNDALRAGHRSWPIIHPIP